MKKTHISLFLIALMFTFSCTKQTDDILGVWKLKSMDIEYSESYNGTVSHSSSYKYDSNIFTIVDDNDVYTFSFSETLTINADGTCKIEIIQDGKTSTSTNYWYYLDTDKDKKAICIDFSLEDFDDSEIHNLKIIELDNKNLQLEKKFNDSDTENDRYEIYKYNRTYVKQ